MCIHVIAVFVLDAYVQIDSGANFADYVQERLMPAFMRTPLL